LTERDLLDVAPVGDNVNSPIGGLFLIAKPSPDAALHQLTQAVDAAFDAAAEDDPAAGAWGHEAVTDNDWLAIKAVPPPTSLADVPEDLLASDEGYQSAATWMRSPRSMRWIASRPAHRVHSRNGRFAHPTGARLSAHGGFTQPCRRVLEVPGAEHTESYLMQPVADPARVLAFFDRHL
jgi:hypothetical protein